MFITYFKEGTWTNCTTGRTVFMYVKLFIIKKKKKNLTPDS